MFSAIAVASDIVQGRMFHFVLLLVLLFGVIFIGFFSFVLSFFLLMEIGNWELGTGGGVECFFFC